MHSILVIKGKEILNNNLAVLPSHDTHNVYTAITTLSIQPQITCYICCPKCFHHYLLGELAKFCTWYKTPWSRLCGEKLWTLRSTCNGSKLVPRRLYNVQVFSSWLEIFLSCPRIEDLIDQCCEHQPPDTGIIYDIWDSLA